MHITDKQKYAYKEAQLPAFCQIWCAGITCDELTLKIESPDEIRISNSKLLVIRYTDSILALIIKQTCILQDMHAWWRRLDIK